MLHRRPSTHQHTYDRQARETMSETWTPYIWQTSMLYFYCSAYALSFLFIFLQSNWLPLTLYLGPSLLQLHLPHMQPQPVEEPFIGMIRSAIILSLHEQKKEARTLKGKKLYRAFWISKHRKGHVARWCNSRRWRFEPAGLLYEHQAECCTHLLLHRRTILSPLGSW
jgi:hypothetical protein